MSDAQTNRTKLQENSNDNSVSKNLSENTAEAKGSAIEKSIDLPGVNITEEQAKNPQAEEEEDLDVIDCYTEDFDSDMERDFCRKEAEKLRTSTLTVNFENSLCSSKPTTERNSLVNNRDCESKTNETSCKKTDTNKALDEKKVEPFRQNESTLPRNIPSETAIMIDEEVDDDVIQINDENIESLLDEPVSKSREEVRPCILFRVKDEKDRYRVLKKPLVKQIIIPEISISDEDDDDEDNDIGSHESLNLQIDHFMDKASELIANKSSNKTMLRTSERHDKNDSDEVEMGLKIGYGPDSSGSCMESFHQEDADFQQLKLEFYDNVGVMDYEPEEEHIELLKCHKTDEEDDESVMPKSMVRIKEEPVTPVKERLGKLNMCSEDIPTIDLTSSEEEEETASESTNEKRINDQKKELKKKDEKKKSDCIALEPFSSEDMVLMNDSVVSENSINARQRNDSETTSLASIDDSMLSMGYSDRVISLRKRKVTVLPEVALTICPKKLRKCHSKIDRVKAKKRDDPAMRGYKRRKPRSGSKTSVVSVSTASSSDTVDDILTSNPSETILDNKKGSDKENRSDNDRKETTDTNQLKDAISKELGAEIPVADSSISTQEMLPINDDFPVATTDIALEDMLESYIACEEEQKNNNPSLFTISTEEKLLMDSLFADCEKPIQQSDNQDIFDVTLVELSSVLEGKPTGEHENNSLDSKQITFNYTISDGVNPPTVVPVHCRADQDSITIQTGTQKGPHFKVIQNYDRYKKLLQNRANKQAKVVEQLVRPKTNRKRPDSDEEYRPKSYMKKRLFARPRKRPSQLVKPNQFLPTGEYLVSDDAADVAQPFKSMPSLEEDLALTSSESSSVENSTIESCSKALVCDQDKQGSQEKINKEENVIQVIQKEEGTVKASTVGKVTPKGTRKRGRPKLHGLKICDYFCASSGQQKTFCTASCCQSGSQASITESGTTGVKVVNKKVTKKRKKKSVVSSSEVETESLDGQGSSCAEDESVSATTVKEVEHTENSHDLGASTDLKMNNVQVIISPLTDEKIRKINTPKKKRSKGLTKACQTEISGLTWSVKLDQIDFHSEHFDKLRVLLNSGATRCVLRRVYNDETKQPKVDRKLTSDVSADFSQIEMPTRADLHRSIGPAPVHPPSDPPVSQVRSDVEELLFQREKDEVDIPPSKPDQQAREQLEQTVKNVRSTFRIPKLVKQPSTSPQPVTSSTQSVLECPGSKNEEQRFARNKHRSEKVQGVVKDSCSTRNDDPDYVDDETESYRTFVTKPQDREGFRSNVAVSENFEPTASIRGNSSSDLNSPLSFANALNANYIPAARNEHENQTNATAVSCKIPQVPLPLEVRSVLPDRAEMMNVKRTIRNDVTQQSTVQPPPASGLQSSLGRPSQLIVDEYKFNQPSLPGFHTFGSFTPYGGNNSAAFSRGLPVCNEMDIKPSISGAYNAWNNYGRNDMMNTVGHPAGINDFVAMLYEQFKQQIPQGPTHMPMFGQWPPPVNIAPTVAPSNPTGHPTETVEMICYLFGCYDFLTDRCIKVNCRYSHVLPREDEVLQKLMSHNCEFIMTTYRLVSNRDDLFVKYFPVYATVMGRNKMRHQLVTTIADCEKPKRPMQYYRFIVDGLKMSGTNAVQAVQILLEKHKKTNFHQINVLIDLILDTGEGVVMFHRWLEDFFNVRGFFFDIPAINRLVDIYIGCEQAPKDLAKLISKLVLKVNTGEEQLINTAALLEFVKKVRQDVDMIVDVEEIVQKYGKVVMRS
ncbi:uncharacterized protein LOC131430628 isoform X2 [Malaya genurostris]|nr:uncharacterized protein LOC131430628 isoform X2 [Malaya genurostris]